MDSTDSFFPRKPPGSGELSVLFYDNCLHRPGFPCPYYCKEEKSQPARLLRAVSYLIQIHKGKPSHKPEQLRRVGEVGLLGWAPASCSTKMPNFSPITENDVCEEEKLEEEPRSDGKLRLWDYQLLKVIFVL